MDKCELRFEAPNEGPALLDCCFESESVALTASSDGSILRFAVCDLNMCVFYAQSRCSFLSDLELVRNWAVVHCS